MKRRVLYFMMVRFSLIIWLITMICSLFHMKVKLPTIKIHHHPICGDLSIMKNLKLVVEMDMVGIFIRKGNKEHEDSQSISSC